MAQKLPLIDRALAAVAPRLALKRQQARMALALSSGYTAASYGRPGLAGWGPRAADADGDTNTDLPVLRARARDLARNAPLASGALNTMVTNVVGTGLSCQPSPDGEALGLSDEEAQAWADATLREFRLWAESTDCDATRTQTLYGLQSLVFRSALESGDAFVLLPQAARPRAPYRLALQVIEADRICNPEFTQDSATVAAGVETDPLGAPVAYHVCRQHPGTARKAGDWKWDRVTAYGNASGRRNVLHVFDRRRPGQRRGVPVLAPVIEPLKQLQRYTDAELQAAVISGMFAVFVKMDPEAFHDMFDQAGKSAYLQSAMGWDGTINGGELDGAGKAINLLPGESVESANPGRPNALFDPFVQAIVRQIGVALELPFEVLIKHFTASYSAARAALLDAWRFFRGRRDWLATVFCQPVYEAWLEEAVALGRVAAPGFFADPAIRRAWCQAIWVGDGPGSIDPQKEVGAAKERIDLGISTIAAESILHDGVDWRIKHKQRAVENDARREAGLLAAPVAAPVTAAAKEETEEDDPDGESAPDKAPVEKAEVHHHHINVTVPPAQVTANIQVPESNITVEAVMPAAEPPVVNMTVPAAPAPAVNVSVEPTPMTLEATINALAAPAQVVVQHPRRAVQTVERDPDGEIKATVTRYDMDSTEEA